MDVVAEGVETQGQLDFLRSIRCDNGQGYLVSKPLSAEMITDILKANCPSRSIPLVSPKRAFT
jgi:EAL domain-containing protein (putative c-di-GMP-specific phosphodiesterase class I)